MFSLFTTAVTASSARSSLSRLLPITRTLTSQPSTQPTSSSASRLAVYEEDVEDDDPLPPLRPHRSSFRHYGVSHPAELDPEDLHPAERRKLARAKNLLARAESDKPRKLSSTKLSVKNIPHGVTAEDLKEAFLSKGIYVRYARILAFPRSDGRFVSRGYGWVSIDDGKGSERKAMEQVQAIDKFIVRDRVLKIEPMYQRLTGSFDRIDPPKPPPEERLPVPGQYASSPLRLLNQPSARESQRFKNSGLIPGQPFPANFDPALIDTGFGLQSIGEPEKPRRDAKGVWRDAKGRFVPAKKVKERMSDELEQIGDVKEGKEERR